MSRVPPFSSAWRAVAVAAALFAASACAPPSSPPGEVTPEIMRGSLDLDSPFLPSHDQVLDVMFEMAGVTPDDFVIDLGSGDGRIVIAAARDHGARGLGVDLNADLVAVARHRARQDGVADRARFEVRDAFKTDISEATVVTLYLLPEMMARLRPKLLSELRAGARIVSHDFDLGDWLPDDRREVAIESRYEEATVYLWIVPEDIGGTWEWELRDESGPGRAPVGYTARIGQKYQNVEGEAQFGGTSVPLRDGRLEGKRVRFSIAGEAAQRTVDHHFDGIIEGDRITGTVTLSGNGRNATLDWEARRTGAGGRR